MCILPTNGSLHADKDEISHNSRYVPRTEFNCVKILTWRQRSFWRPRKLFRLLGRAKNKIAKVDKSVENYSYYGLGIYTKVNGYYHTQILFGGFKVVQNVLNLTPSDLRSTLVLRTFARKFSSIDFFLKILPLKDDELVI